MAATQRNSQLHACLAEFQRRASRLGPTDCDEVAALLKQIEAETHELQQLRVHRSAADAKANTVANAASVQQLIKCGRLQEAESALAQLPQQQQQGDTRSYLGALLHLCNFDLHSAARVLAGAPATAQTPSSPKDASTTCNGRLTADALSPLHTLVRQLQSVQQLLAAGQVQAARTAVERSVAQVKEAAQYQGVQQCVQVMRAQTLVAMDGADRDRGIQVLKEVIAAGTQQPSPSTQHALWHLAHALLAMGRAEEAFQHLHRLQTLQPHFPGLQQAIQRAAAAALEQSDDSDDPTWGMDDRVTESCRVLGIDVKDVQCLSKVDLDRRYRRRAAECHPDRAQPGSSSSTGSGAVDGHETFVAVRRAYEYLSTLVI